MRALVLSLAVLAPFALAACAESPPAPGSESTDPALLFTSGSEWRVVAIDLAPVPAGISPTLRREGDSVSGHGGCNRFGGTIAIEGERLSFGPLVSTRMACPQPVMQVDARLHDALRRVDGVRGIVGGTLQLTASTRPVVTLTPATAP